MGMTADQLDAAILRRCFWPSTNAPLTQAQRLAIADEEILGCLYPKVIAAHADYYQTILDQSITNAQDQYKLPMRTYGPLKDISVVDSGGNEFSCPMIDAEELGHGVWVSRYYGQFNGGGVSFSFYLNGDSINLRPIPNQTEHTLRVRYYRVPSSLVLEAAARKIIKIAFVEVDSGDYIYTVTVSETTAPTGWASILSSQDLWVDILNAGNAHQNLAPENTIDLIGEGSHTTFTYRSRGAALPTSLTTGESDKSLQLADSFGFLGWLALAGQTPIVQLPDFMLPAAVRKIAAACLEAHGDDRADRERGEAEDMIELAIETGAPRIEGEPKFITSPNGPFRSGRMSFWGR